MADLTYLANTDPTGATNPFYALAKQYFVANGSTVVDAPSEGQTLEGILEDLKTREGVQATVNIVSLATGLGALGLPVTLAKQAVGCSVTAADDVRDALAKKTLVPPGPAVIDETTRVVIYGCDIGRSTTFLTLLSSLFGSPGELLAPRRLGLFTLDRPTALYRQAQTWTLVKKAPLIPAGADAPVGGWVDYRAQFAADASAKFGPVAADAEADGETQLTTILSVAANAATVAIGAALFIEVEIGISATATQTASQVVDSMTPMANGDPVTAAAQSAAQVDDTTVVTTVSGADAYLAKPDKTQYSITLVLLAQIIDQDVPIAEGPGYARVTSGKALAPSTGPEPTTGDAGGGGSSGAGGNDLLQSVTQQLLAAGVTQDDINTLLASVPTGDATEDIDTDAPATVPIDGDTGSGFPPTLETA